MYINNTFFNNASTTSIWSATELLSYNDFFEQGIAAMTTALQSRLSSLLFFIVCLIWTRIQRKFILILTEIRNQIIYFWIQRNRGQGTQSKSRDGDTAQDERKLGGDAFIVVYIVGLLHMAMYPVYLEYGFPNAGQILICLVPLLLPRSFYLEWPTLSKFFIMLWGKLWVPDVDMAAVLIAMFHAFLYLCVILAPFWAFIKCNMDLKEAEEALPMAQREHYIHDNFCTHIKSTYLPTLKETICLWASWTLRTLQDLLSL